MVQELKFSSFFFFFFSFFFKCFSSNAQICFQINFLSKDKLEATEDVNKLKIHVDEKEKELEATREVATREIDDLKTRLSFANKLVFKLKLQSLLFVSL